jgi:UDP-N-acetylglucosamine diphosphorylase / glucose-1-phosphate thymidylyltransferase / UDP-N-acetylgalactosamine diphosphorylase / glucosamine-1-phosphate N-acetyltransferase / galactosamine-1-phosphate N-acetyltransferase
VIVVVPMAGRGSRFAGHPDDLPKPLVPVAGRPMVRWALDSLEGLDPSLLVFVALAEHDARFGLGDLLREWAPPASRTELVWLDDVTEGQLCTVLAARALIDLDEDLLVASCDTYVRSDLGRDVAGRDPECRGLISVARMPGDHWSFARLGPDGHVAEVAEKVRISEWASTGLYHFSSGREFVEIGQDMVDRNERTRDEFYVIPVYGRFVERGLRIDVSVADEVWDLGTPTAAAAFERHLAATREAHRA